MTDPIKDYVYMDKPIMFYKGYDVELYIIFTFRYNDYFEYDIEIRNAHKLKRKNIKYIVNIIYDYVEEQKLIKFVSKESMIRILEDYIFNRMCRRYLVWRKLYSNPINSKNIYFSAINTYSSAFYRMMIKNGYYD